MDLLKWMRNQWDRSAALGVSILGALAILLAYLGVSDATLPAQQIPYVVSGGIFGLFLLGIGTTLWLSADLRDEWRKLDEIHRDLRKDDEPEVTPAAGNGAAVRSPRRAKTSARS